jgi:hypothetical protein
LRSAKIIYFNLIVKRITHGLDARGGPGGFDGSNADGDGQFVFLDAGVDGLQDVLAHDTQVADGLQGGQNLKRAETL